jgi:choline dehydrogenase-like flavoprotein
MGGLEIPRFLLNCIPGSYGLTELVDRGLGKYYMNHPKYENCGHGDLVLEHSISSAISQFYGDTPLRDQSSVHIYAYLVPDPANRDKSINNFRMAISLPAQVRFQLVKVSCEINFEQEPNAASTITLAKEVEPDIFKMRRLSLDWRFLEKDALTMTGAIEQTKQLFASLGNLLSWQATDWTFDPALPYPPLSPRLYTGDHHMGVCRMRSDDAVDDGVVNSRCQASQFTNLWLCSTGVFRRGGWANATLTLLALALRLADDLAEEPPLQAA